MQTIDADGWAKVFPQAEVWEHISRQSREENWDEKQTGRALVEAMMRAACEYYCQNPPPHVDEPKGIHYTDLPEAKPDSPLYHEWNYYRREVGRLLGKGLEGKFVLIKGEELVGIWNTLAEAEAVALRFFLMQSCLIHQIRSREPLLHGPSVLWRCRS